MTFLKKLGGALIRVGALNRDYTVKCARQGKGYCRPFLVRARVVIISDFKPGSKPERDNIL